MFYSGCRNICLPLVFLAVAVVLNIVLDLVFILYFGWGVRGAALATVIAQAVSGIGLCFYSLYRFPDFRVSRQNMQLKWATVKEIATYSSLTCAQQSVMNFGILMVQGLINSFGTAVMAGFAAAVKIDSFAYMPVQDFGNAFSTFIAQNFGAGKHERIRKGIRVAVRVTLIFCLIISVLVFVLARPLMLIFIPAHETEIISIGVEYLRIEGAFLLWHWLVVFIIWFLSCCQETRNVCRVDRYIPGCPGGPGLYLSCYSGYRCMGNLVVYSYRMVFGRYFRLVLLSNETKKIFGVVISLQR